MNWQVGVEEFARESRMLADLCESAGRGPASIRWTHAPNFQLFDSEREFARWQQDKRLGLSAEDVYAYIRSRGAVCMARLRPSRRPSGSSLTLAAEASRAAVPPSAPGGCGSVLAMSPDGALE